MNIDRAIRDYERSKRAEYDRENDAAILRHQFSHIDPDGPRPHGMNPAIFNGPCDCDDCQYWDVVQRECRQS